MSAASSSDTAAAATAAAAAAAAAGEGFDSKVQHLQAQLRVAKTKVYNLDRSDPRLSLAARRQVKKGTMTEDEAVQAEKKEAQDRIDSINAELKQIEVQRQQAVTVQNIDHKTDTILSHTANMLPMLTELHEAIVKGTPPIPRDAPLDQGRRVVRHAKCALTNVFQYMGELKKANPEATCGQALENIESVKKDRQENQKKVALLKQALELAKSTVVGLKIQKRQLKNSIDLSTCLCNDDEVNEKQDTLNKVEAELLAATLEQTAAKQAYETSLASNRPRKQLATEPDTKQQQLELDLDKAKEQHKAQRQVVKDATKAKETASRGCTTATANLRTASKLAKSKHVEVNPELAQAKEAAEANKVAKNAEHAQAKVDLDTCENGVRSASKKLQHYKEFGAEMLLDDRNDDQDDDEDKDDEGGKAGNDDEDKDDKGGEAGNDDEDKNDEGGKAGFNGSLGFLKGWLQWLPWLP
jgi:hypothetical protein